MTTLTLDLAKTILYSASSSQDALSKLIQAGFAVVKSYSSYIHIVDLGGDDHISFSSVSKTCEHLHIVICGEYITPSERKAFLESQQQSSDSVLDASPAEARPESFVTSIHSPSDSEWQDISTNLFGFFTVLGYLPNRDETFQRVFYGYVCSALGPQKNVFDASLRTLLDALTLAHDRLSTESVDKVGQ